MAATLATLAVAVVGCSDDDSDDGADSPEPSATSPEADGATGTSAVAVADGMAAGGDTRTVDSARGPIEVPADPQRVVALDPFVTLQTLDELGAPLVAAGSLGGETRSFVSDEAHGLPSVGIGTELNYEAIAASQPDVIVGLETYGEEIHLLDEIAPTVLVPSGNWKDNIVVVADAVGLADDAEVALAVLDDRVEQLASAIEAERPDGLRVSLLRVPPDGPVRAYTTYFDNFIASEVIGRLPVTMVGDELADSEDVSYAEVGAELLEEVDADVIVYYIGGGVLTTEEAEQASANLLDNPLWPTLDAVSNDHAYEVDAELWFSGSNVQAAEQLLDDIERHLVDASADGNR